MVGPAPFSWYLGGCALPAACPNVSLQQRDYRPWLVWDARIVDELSCPLSCLSPFPPCSLSCAMALHKHGLRLRHPRRAYVSTASSMRENAMKSDNIRERLTRLETSCLCDA